MKETQSYVGFISLGSFDEILLDGEPIAKVIDNDDWAGKTVHLRYFVSNSPFESMDDAVEKHVMSVLGLVDAEYWEIHGSEWTGQYGVHETLTIGGHDLIEELSTHLRRDEKHSWESPKKYVAIEVQLSDPESATTPAASSSTSSPEIPG